MDFSADVATIIDVGASRGQFALFALARFPHARLICFEPLSESRVDLEHVLPRERVTIHGVALGRERGDLELHVSAAADSSSLLPISERQVQAFPGTEQKRTERVAVRVLEDYVAADLGRPALLKIDVQGFELAVLEGASASLEHVDEVFVECSFEELYKGQALADAVVCKLRCAGFWLVGVYGVVRTRDGGCLQADFLFRRPEPQPSMGCS